GLTVIAGLLLKVAASCPLILARRTLPPQQAGRPATPSPASRYASLYCSIAWSTRIQRTMRLPLRQRRRGLVRRLPACARSGLRSITTRPTSRPALESVKVAIRSRIRKLKRSICVIPRLPHCLLDGGRTTAADHQKG